MNYQQNDNSYNFLWLRDNLLYVWIFLMVLFTIIFFIIYIYQSMDFNFNSNTCKILMDITNKKYFSSFESWPPPLNNFC